MPQFQIHSIIISKRNRKNFDISVILSLKPSTIPLKSNNQHLNKSKIKDFKTISPIYLLINNKTVDANIPITNIK